MCVCATNIYVFPCKWNLKRQRIRRRESQRNISIFVRFDSVFSELVRCAVFVCWFRHVLCCMPSHSFAITIYLNFKIINQPCKVIYGTFFNRFSGGPFNTMHFYCSLKRITITLRLQYKLYNSIIKIFGHAKPNQMFRFFHFYFTFFRLFYVCLLLILSNLFDFFLDSKQLAIICRSLHQPQHILNWPPCKPLNIMPTMPMNWMATLEPMVSMMVNTIHVTMIQVLKVTSVLVPFNQATSTHHNQLNHNTYLNNSHNNNNRLTTTIWTISTTNQTINTNQQHHTHTDFNHQVSDSDWLWR